MNPKQKFTTSFNQGAEAHRWFLDALARKTDALKGLTDVLPAYVTALENDDASDGYLLAWSALLEASSSNSHALRLRDCVIAWARPLNLTEEHAPQWFFDAVLATLEQMEQADRAINATPVSTFALPSQDTSGGVAWLFGLRPEFELRLRWDRASESKASFKRRLEAEFERAKDEFFNAAHQRLDVSQALPEPIKTNLEHFEWLVLHHCKGLRFPDIANEYGLRRPGNVGAVRNTVRDAVGKTAELVGLKLIPSKKGR